MMFPRCLVLFSSVVLLSGCQFFKPKAAPSPVPTPAPKAPPKIDYAKVKPNELGRIPIVMYHSVGGKEGKDTKLNRTVASFNRDLALLYKHNYVPVNMVDVLENRIDIPAGKRPVVLTFDDARESQFKLLEQQDSFKVDPNCAVGLIEAFCKSHSDWQPRATFYVLPKSPLKQDIFDQNGLGPQKMKYLLDKGFEIGNHSITHKSFAGYNAQKLEAEIGGAQKLITEAAPGVKVTSLALPYGAFPRNKALWPSLIKGSGYNYIAALDAAWQPSPSPAAKDFNPLRVQRITPEDIQNGLANWILRMDKSSPFPPYVSDGDPTTLSFPASEKSKLDPAKAKAAGLLVNAYGAGGGGMKPIIDG